jgi:hypothetical protein
MIFSAAIFLAAGTASLSDRTEKKTLQRVEDPVVMECKDMGPLFGSAVDTLALMARSGEAWSPIPFQVDQKKPDGSYAFTSGPEASPDPNPNLDANDELVFMAKGSGDRAEDGKWPEGAKTVMEIALTDPKNGQKGWVYLARFSSGAPRSSDDYIKLFIDKAANRRGVRTYEYVGSSPMDGIAIDYLAANTAADGRPGKDVLDRLKIRGELIFPGGIIIPIKVDEMMKGEDRAYIDGPVRVLQLSRGYLKLAGISVKGTGDMVIKFYVNYNSFPVHIKSPELPSFLKGLMPKVRLKAFLDFNPDIKGFHSFSPANPYNDRVVLDGVMSAAEKSLDTKTPIDWIGGSGPQGAIVSRLILGKEIVGKYKKKTYYLDDASVSDPPEDHKGVQGLGYMLEGEGEYVMESSFECIIYIKQKLKPENIPEILDILDHPIQVGISKVK